MLDDNNVPRKIFDSSSEFGRVVTKRTNLIYKLLGGVLVRE